MTTEIASAVDRVPLGDLTLVRPSPVTPSRSSRKTVTTRRISSRPSGAVEQVEGAAHLVDAAGDDVDLGVGGGGQGQYDGVEAAAQGAGELVDPAVAVVGGGDEVEAADGLHLLAELRYRQGLLRQDGDQGVLDVGGDAGELLDAGGHAVGHGAHDGAGYEGFAAGAVGEEPGVVPAVADGFLGGACGALDEEGRVSADGRGEVFGHPGLGGAGDAEQEQRAVGGEGGDGDLDDAARSDVLGRDDRAVIEGAAEQVGGDGPRGELPAGRAGPVVGGRQGFQFVREGVFGVRSQRLGARAVLGHGHGPPPMLGSRSRLL